jgi:hypothetical protein
MTNSYALRSPLFVTNASFGLSLFRDAPSEERKLTIDFHVKSGDYFGTLATIMGLIADSLSSNQSDARERSAKTLVELREDLSYSQETYTIKSK